MCAALSIYLNTRVPTIYLRKRQVPSIVCAFHYLNTCAPTIYLWKRQVPSIVCAFHYLNTRAPTIYHWKRQVPSLVCAFHYFNIRVLLVFIAVEGKYRAQCTLSKTSILVHQNEPFIMLTKIIGSYRNFCAFSLSLKKMKTTNHNWISLQ